MEEWRDIKNFEGMYQVSNLGRVKRLPNYITMRNQVTSWEHFCDEYIFTPSLDSKGYLQVVLSVGENKRTARVHRLVAETFLEEPSAELVQECKSSNYDVVLVNHIDSNRLNNSVANLEWCSPTYNNEHCVISGNLNCTSYGEDSYSAILTEEDVIDIINLLKKGGISQQKIADRYGVKQITISNIWTGRSWAWLTGIPKTKRNKSKLRSKSISEKQQKCS